MTNAIAISIAVALGVALALDYHYMDGAVTLIFARKFVEMIEWLTFWR